MALTHLTLEVANPANLGRWQSIEVLLDSGAIYSVIPSATLSKLGIRPSGSQEFQLADGRKITRSKGTAEFRFQGKLGGADVIFGQKGDATLLGLLTLNALGLWLDPLSRELRESPMVLAGWLSPAA